MTTTRTWKLVALVLAIAFLVAACGGDGDDDGADDAAGTDETTATEETEEPDDTGDTDNADAAASADLNLAPAEMGDILVDSQGNTIYLFAPDEQGESTCYDQCEASWPIVGELATVGDGLDSSLLGTTERTTGDVQATYNGWPLYYFANDAAPGDTTGQGANDVWFVMDAAGNAVTG